MAPTGYEAPGPRAISASAASATGLVVFVDVDDTLVRSFGAKRTPMASVVEHVRLLSQRGVDLYCWSSGGAEYARVSAEELGLEFCFIGYLPKPNVMIDDQPFEQWRRFMTFHPNEAVSQTVEEYQRLVLGKNADKASPQ